VFGETDREIAFDDLREIGSREEIDDAVQEHPGPVLIALDPNLALDRRGKKVRSRELRVAREVPAPIVERIFSQRDLVDDRRIGRMRPRRDRRIPKRVVHFEIAHLHAPEIPIRRRRVLKLFALFALVFRERGRWRCGTRRDRRNQQRNEDDGGTKIHRP
jgi:hypothetical protein